MAGLPVNWRESWRYRQIISGGSIFSFSRAHTPTPATVCLECNDSQSIRVEQCLRRWKRILVMLPELSGGYKMEIIDNQGEWNNYYNELSGTNDTKDCCSVSIFHMISHLQEPGL